MGKTTLTMPMETLKSESLMFFGNVTRKDKVFKLFYGIGVVYRVVKGDKSDLVYVNFGIFQTKYPRLIVVYSNHARRQLLTLKRGQVCQVYGLARYSTYEYNGEIKTRLGLYATGLIGWYVPTMLDIKKMPTNTDLVAPSEKEKDFMDNYDEILNEFTNGKEDL